MSTRSRALDDLADHFEVLAKDARGWEKPDENVPPLFADLVAGLRRARARPIYSGSESWDNAADMARRTAHENTWTHRIWHARIADRLYGWTCALIDWSSRRGHTDDNWWVRALAWVETKLGGIT